MVSFKDWAKSYLDIIFVVILSLIICFCYALGVMRSYENVILDRMMVYFSDTKKIDSKLVYLLTTQRSLHEAEHLYQMGWPWKRSTYATMIKTLNKFGARSIVFDAIFTEKSVYTYLGEPDDQELTATLYDHDNVIFANFFSLPKKTLDRVVARQVKQIIHKYEQQLRNEHKSKYHVSFLIERLARIASLNLSSQQLSQMTKGKMTKILHKKVYHRFLTKEKQNNQYLLGKKALNVIVKHQDNVIPKYYRHNPPISPFLMSAPILGSVTGLIDEDNTTRRTPLLINYLNKYYPSLSMAALIHHKKPKKLIVDKTGIWMDDLFIPLNYDGYFTLKYYGYHQDYPRYDQIDLLQLGEYIDEIYALYQELKLENPIPKSKLYEHSKFIEEVYQVVKQKQISFVPAFPKKLMRLVSPQSFKGKIVMIGDTIPGHFDLKPTPFGNKEIGAHVHVTAINNILNQDMPIQIRESFYLVFCLFITPIFFAVLIRRMSIYLSSLVTLVFIIGIFGLSVASFIYLNYLVDTLSFIISGVLTFPIVSAVNFFKESEKKRYLQTAFGQYLSPKVVKIIIQNPEKLSLGGAKKHVTAFFSDLQGFTKISESLEPEELVSILNEYLTEMCDIILINDGVIDKFEGDAIIAFWGAPLEYVDHARLACYSAIQMQQTLANIRADWKLRNKPQFYMRIGLNTGDAVVGNMGSKQRMDYTMIGDMVNLAARLEGINKVYGTFSLISEYTYQEAKSYIDVRYLGKVRAIGKAVPIGVYELLSKKNETPGKIADGIDLFHKALKSYENADFSSAITQFQRVQTIIPNDPPSQFFIDLSSKYQKEGIPSDWDAIYQLTHK